MEQNDELKKEESTEVIQPKVKVHFCKENVYIYPSSKEGIAGYIYILEKPNMECFLAWTPYFMLQQKKDSDVVESNQSDLYAVQVPLKEVRAIKRYTPSLKVPHIIIVSESGVAFPPYYFNSGGVREFCNALRAHVNLIKSDEDANTWYLTDLDDHLSLTGSRLNRSREPSGDLTAILSNQSMDITDGLNSLQVNNDYNGVSSNSVNNNSTTAPVQPNQLKSQTQPQIQQPQQQIQAHPQQQLHHHNKSSNMENFSWTLLENFSKVTQFARNAAKGTGNFLNNIDAQILASTDTKVYSPKYGKQENTQNNNTNNNNNKQKYAHTTQLGSFEILDSEYIGNYQEKGHRTKELSPEEFMEYFDSEGRITNEPDLKKRIFYGGVDPTIRVEVWKYLLNLYPFNSTFEEREQILKKKREEYFKWKSTWQFIESSPGLDFHWNKFKTRCHNIEKDVVRTDRTLEFYTGEKNPNLKMLHEILITYTFFNFDLGYVQGMNELLSPILYIMENEADAYWCFKNVMDIMECNFHKDQNGMHIQLSQIRQLIETVDPGLLEYFKANDCLNMFFCFRWVLIHFKREFSFSTIQRLWETMWSNPFTPNFHLFVAVAILLKHRKTIIANQMQFDDIVKYINELAGTLQLEEILVDAEELYHAFMRIAKPEVKESLQKKASKKVDSY